MTHSDKRTPIEILAAAAERQRLVKEQDAEHVMIWEMFGAMWGLMQPVMEDIQFIARAMRTTTNMIVLAGKITAALTAIGAGVVFVLLAFGNDTDTIRITCDSFRTQAEAQAYYDSTPGDPFNLDDDGDRVPCEGLP